MAAVNATLAALLAVVLLIYPPVRALIGLNDPALKGPGVPKIAWRLARELTPRYASWASHRIAARAGRALSTNDISGTEWPLFGSVFYLWAMENLQNAWQAGDHTAGAEPKSWAKNAIVAASELVIDPNQAAWVEQHWGTNYLHRENVFYRMLIIAALASRQQLLHDGAHLDMLRDQVESFSHELDTSPCGLLDDYPGECYPGDVMAAVFAIRRSDAALGADHSDFAARELRAFLGSRATRLKLPPYFADAKTGAPLSVARGCANSYFGLTAPELWPGAARSWFESYEKNFWQERLGFAGFREFPAGVPRTDWTIDVDAGPVIDGFGVAANAFGVGAARKNGRFDLAYPLSTEMLATVWELPNGVLALPRARSNLSDAPMLGEAAILWLLTEQPQKGLPMRTGGKVPTFVYVLTLSALVLGLWAFIASGVKIAAVGRAPAPVVRAQWLQFVLWAGLLGGAGLLCLVGRGLAALPLCLAAFLLPRKSAEHPTD